MAEPADAVRGAPPPVRPAARRVGARVAGPDQPAVAGRRGAAAGGAARPRSTRPATCAPATPGRTASEPRLHAHLRVHERLRRAPADDEPTSTIEDGLLRAEGEQGTCRVHLLLAAPRPHARAAWRRRRPSGRRPVGGADGGARGGATGGSRCSRTGARRWARRTRTRTARSGPARRCPTSIAREDASQRAYRARPAASCSPTSSTRRRRAARRRGERRLARDRAVLGRLAVRGAACCRAAGRADAGPRRRRARRAGRDPRARRSAGTTRCSACRSRTRWAGTGRRSATDAATDAWRLHAHAYPPLLRRRPCASSWSATSCSPRRSATSRPRTRPRGSRAVGGRGGAVDADVGRAVRRAGPTRGWRTSRARSTSTRRSRSTTSRARSRTSAGSAGPGC